uniref:Putative inactive cadmium/zinc-transporting ATPase HMA3 n=1 Tax=Davidia involucrata TaxID=16924 RepID=A0A5B7AV73_DAVIN
MAVSDKNELAVVKLQKSYFDVLGLCCSSEVPLIEKILKPLDGVKDVSVIVPSKTVIVLHDNLLISQVQIVKALNKARLEANVRVYGEGNYKKEWPSPYAVACGILLVLSFLKYVYRPFQWLALGAVAIGICPIVMRGAAAIRNLTLDVNILVIIAVVGSIALNDYWEAGSIVFLFTIAEWLESRASHKATAVMSSLMNIVPQSAVLAETGEEIDVEAVKVNAILAVKAGEIIAIDGIVVQGECEVDEKTLTGESFPVSKQKESTVWAGTINLNGYISVKTSALAKDCVVARMAKLVEEAQNNKSKTQRFIDNCAKYYTPAIVFISACLVVIPAALRVHNQNQWFHLALVVLVSACPCALILSTPVATFCALSKAATLGVLIKGGEYLETFAKIKIMAFDKTGTITRGQFTVTYFRSLLDDVSLNSLLYWVSSIESKSSHPMAAALVEYGQSHSVEPKGDMVEEFQNFPGEGIYGKIDGKGIYVGNKRMAMRAGCETLIPSLEGDTKEGKSIGYVFCGARAAGIFSVSDACRSGVKEAIEELKSIGIKTAMLTGDSKTAAMHAQDELGGVVDIVHAELLPEDKARIIKEFQKEAPTGMIGDGLNDAPALATADIGISMGIAGSALATETGHVILMSNDIRNIPKAARLAKRTRRKVIENVILSITTKSAILALAFAGHPLVWAAVLADVGTCLLVILNSMLLLQATHAQQHHHNHNHCSSQVQTPKQCSDSHDCCASGYDQLQEAKHSDHQRCDMHQDTGLHNHASTSCDHCTNWVENHIAHEELGSMVDPPIGEEVHSKCNKHGAIKACMSLEKRQIGGCCKSYRKECCQHFGANLGGGLSEISIE